VMKVNQYITQSTSSPPSSPKLYALVMCGDVILYMV
jgi:hypothetical protein